MTWRSRKQCVLLSRKFLREHTTLKTQGQHFQACSFTSSATLGASTTAYATTNEVSGTGYSAGGNTLTRVDLHSGTTAFDFADTTFSTATITANGALIYNSSASDAVIVLALAGDKTSTAGDFTVQFPTADAVTLLSVSPKR